MGERLAALWHDEWGRLLALLVAQFRRLDLAEDGLADAFEAAARTWPRDGVPANPPAWLLTVARRRIVDRLRSEATAARKLPLLLVDSHLQEEAQRVMADAGEVVHDERLRLVLLCAHPSLAPESAAALTLRLVLGVPTADIARLFLVSTPTMAARLTRARKRLAAERFELPDGPALVERVGLAADIAYLAFTAGYAPASGDAVHRPDLAGEAIRLVRLLRELCPAHRRARRAAGADVAAALPPGCAGATMPASWCCSPTRTGHGGTGPRSTRRSSCSPRSPAPRRRRTSSRR